MIVLTCISDENNKGYNLALKKSCSRYNLNLETLVHDGNWKNHRIKDIYTEAFLARLNPQEVVLFTDGYDTLFVSNEKEILEKYYSFDAPVIFSTEANCAPYRTFAYLYRDSTSKFNYLNSGGYIGRAGDLLKLYKVLKSIDLRQSLLVDRYYQWSNQYHWMKLYLYFNSGLKLDTQCNLFQTFPNDLDFNPDPLNSQVVNDLERNAKIETEIKRIMADFEFASNRIVNKLTQSTPSHLHFNSIYMKDYIFDPSMRSIASWLNDSEYNQTTVA